MESLPDKMAVFWKNHLKDVDFSENTLREVPLGLFQLDVSLIAPYFSFSAFVRKSLHIAVKPVCFFRAFKTKKVERKV